jgi:hypothetical protein
MDATVHAVFGMPLELTVAAPQIPMDVSRGSRDDHLLLYTTSDRRTHEGPIRYEVSVPGYSLIDSEIFAAPLDGQVPVITLNPLDQGLARGTLRIQVLQLPTFAEAPFDEESTIGLVWLKSSGGALYSLAAHWRETELLEDIPCGTYEYKFKAAVGYFRFPYWTREVPTTAVCPYDGDVSLDMSGLGTIQVLFQFSNGTFYDGEAIVRCTDLASDGVFYASWERAPYFISLLPCGQYSLIAQRLDGVNTSTMAPAEASVSPNEEFLCPLFIPTNR